MAPDWFLPQHPNPTHEEVPMKLDPESLQVSTFPTSSEKIGPGGTIFCCTGCDSGCGINPTAGGCDSQGNTYEFHCQQEAMAFQPGAVAAR